MIKDLNDKAFKYYIYTEHYNIVLDLVRGLRSEKTSSITFNKKSRPIDQKTINGTKIKDFYNYYKITKKIRILKDIYTTRNIKQY